MAFTSPLHLHKTIFIPTVVYITLLRALGLHMAQTVKNLLAMQETQVQSLDREDLLEKGTATHSSILAWRIPWIEEPGGLQSMSRKQLNMTE